MNQHIKDTAKAWGLSQKRTEQLHLWVGSTIEPHRRGTIFATMLRKYQHTPTLSPKKPEPLVSPVLAKLTKEEVESRRYTKAQLAEWGVSWPPPKGWKKLLLKP